ncbi:MAG: ROK family protein [Anaerolineae bacterium]|nr:ROK family protein [Anaerolineae bacterium]
MDVLGIDIGGSGVKGAVVDVRQGHLLTERRRIPTPQPSTPEAVADVVAEIVAHFDWRGPVGCTFPAVIKHGVVYTAANVDRVWIGTDGRKLLEKKTGDPVCLLNDADAAGMAEMAFGAGKERAGIVFLLTLGTGIGSAVFVDGALMPNTELGHLTMHGVDAEDYASDRVRKEEDLSWEAWSARLDEYLHLLEFLFSPDLFILGGGVSKKHEKYLHLLRTQTEIVPAKLQNEAGIVGAALAAQALAGEGLR